MQIKDFLLDTNIIASYTELKSGCKSPECHNLDRNLSKLMGDPKLLVSVISVGEIEYGLNVAPTKDIVQQQLTREVVAQFPILNIDSNVAKNYGSLRGKLFNHCFGKNRRGSNKRRLEEWLNPATSKELQIQENDLWMVSIAMTYNLTFVTHDKMIPLKFIADPDVSFEDWLI